MIDDFLSVEKYNDLKNIDIRINESVLGMLMDKEEKCTSIDYKKISANLSPGYAPQNGNSKNITDFKVQADTKVRKDEPPVNSNGEIHENRQNFQQDLSGYKGSNLHQAPAAGPHYRTFEPATYQQYYKSPIQMYQNQRSQEKDNLH